MSDRINEIRDRLYPITGYEFEACFPNMVRQKNNDPAIRPLIFARDCAAPAFIANAPADIAWLLAEVERLREQVADAWDLGVRAGWAMSGEGWNAEYPGDIDPLDELNYANPYREETT